MVLESKFDLGQPVKITAIGMPGRIDAIQFYENGQPEYRVVFWNDGKREAMWLYEWEVE